MASKVRESVMDWLRSGRASQLECRFQSVSLLVRSSVGSVPGSAVPGSRGGSAVDSGVASVPDLAGASVLESAQV